MTFTGKLPRQREVGCPRFYRHVDGHTPAVVWDSPSRPDAMPAGPTNVVDALFSIACRDRGEGMGATGQWTIMMSEGVGGAAPAPLLVSGVHFCQLSLDDDGTADG